MTDPFGPACLCYIDPYGPGCPGDICLAEPNLAGCECETDPTNPDCPCTTGSFGFGCVCFTDPTAPGCACFTDPEGQDCLCFQEPDSPGCDTDPCLSDPTAPGCPQDPCLLDPTAPGCPVDPCVLDPMAPGCPQDPCILHPEDPNCIPPPPDGYFYIASIDFGDADSGFFRSARMGIPLHKPEYVVDKPANFDHPAYNDPATFKQGASEKLTVELRTVGATYDDDVTFTASYGATSLMVTPATARIHITTASGSQTVSIVITGMPQNVSLDKLKLTVAPKGSVAGIDHVNLEAATAIYQVMDTPTAPMTVPWIDVLNDACKWAAGKSTADDIAAAETIGLFKGNLIKYATDQKDHWTIGDGLKTFKLKGFFAHRMDDPTHPIDGDCADVSDYLAICGNALGLKFKCYRCTGDPPLQVVDPNNPLFIPSTIETHRICPIGKDPGVAGNYQNYFFNNHQFAVISDDTGATWVYDACAAQAFSVASNPTGGPWSKPPTRWSVNGYWQTQTSPTTSIGLVWKKQPSQPLPFTGNPYSVGIE